MGKGASASPPKVPDPVATANAQAAANKETAIAQSQLNMVNQNTPFGSLAFEQTGEGQDGTPTFTATQTLAPEQQALLDETNKAALAFGQTANNQLATVQDRLSQPVNFDQFGAAPQANEATRLATRDAILARAQPDIDRDRAALEAQLVNQGFERGSTGFDDQFRNFNQGVNDLRLGADAAAGSEMARVFGLENAARNAQINELVQQRQIPLNELAAMLSGSQVQGPQFISAPQTGVSPTDVIGATFGAFNGEQNNFQIQNGLQASNNQGLFGLAGAGLGALGSIYGGQGMSFSDARLKRDISPIGAGWYRYRYIWSDDWQIGVMAQEVQKTNPAAVHNIGGWLAVDYGALS